MEQIYKCPKCGEKGNLHFNYDYNRQHRPIKDVLCNECGEIFEGNMPVDVFITKATSEYPELEGTMNLCEEIIQKRTGKMTEEEWQAAERAQTSTKTETTADYIDRHIIQSMLEFAREINSVSDEVILQTAQEKSDMFVKWHEHSTEFGHLAYVRGFVDAIEWYRDKLKKPKNEIND